MPVITGAAKYPENLVEKMKATGAKVDALDCLALAEQAGSSKAVNIVLMGRLSHYFDLPEEAWQASLEAMVPRQVPGAEQEGLRAGESFLKESFAKNFVQSCALPLCPLEEMPSIRRKPAGKADGMGFTYQKQQDHDTHKLERDESIGTVLSARD